MVSLRRAKIKKKREGFPAELVDKCNSVVELEALVRIEIPKGAISGDIIEVREGEVKIKGEEDVSA